MARRGDRGAVTAEKPGLARTAAIGARPASFSSLVVVHDAAARVGFDAAAVEHHLFQGPAPSLHAGLHAGEREAGLDGGVLLREPFEIDQGHGLAAVRWQAREHGPQAMGQFLAILAGCLLFVLEPRPGVRYRKLKVRWGARQQLPPPHRRPVVVRYGIAGDLEEPGDEPLLLLHRASMAMDAQEDILQDALGICRTFDPPPEEGAQAVTELGPYPCVSLA
jgi:hypothetical protein